MLADASIPRKENRKIGEHPPMWELHKRVSHHLYRIGKSRRSGYDRVGPRSVVEFLFLGGIHRLESNSKSTIGHGRIREVDKEI